MRVSVYAARSRNLWDTNNRSRLVPVEDLADPRFVCMEMSAEVARDLARLIVEQYPPTDGARDDAVALFAAADLVEPPSESETP